MHWAEMVVLIVLIATIGRIVRTRYQYGWRQEQQGPRADPNESDRLRAEIRDLKDRIAVLERLATDDNSNSVRLDREIERLRDRSER